MSERAYGVPWVATGRVKEEASQPLGTPQVSDITKEETCPHTEVKNDVVDMRMCEEQNLYEQKADNSTSIMCRACEGKHRTRTRDQGCRLVPSKYLRSRGNPFDLELIAGHGDYDDD